MKKSKNVQKKESEPSDQKEKVSGPPFQIRMGFPHMDSLWNDLSFRAKSGKLSKAETNLYTKWGKALRLLSQNPFYPGLRSHEISSLTQKYGKKVFESYLENHTPAAARMFWCYGPDRGEITILALEPHPEPGSYGRVQLSNEP